MRRLVLGFFAAIGILVVGLLAVMMAVWIFAGPSEPSLAAANILMLDFTRPLPEGAPGSGFERVVLGEQTTLRDVLDGLQRAGDDGRIKGVLARVGGDYGTAEMQELRDAVAAFRAKGKFAIAYADGFGEVGSGTRGYYLASSFDEIWLQPLGEVGLVGLRIETPFFHDLLDKIGVTPRFDHRSEYKTALNPLTETKMTPAHREETESLLRSVYGQIVRGIAAGRKLDETKVETLIDGGPYGTQAALDAHLVDHLGYRDDAIASARTRAGENAKLVTLTTYLDRVGHPHESGPTIAVIYANGLITQGESSGNPLSGSGILGADTLGRAFREAAKDSSVRAILFRIDSPGGSATASESIWRETLRAKEAGKPLIVSMGNVAGSGGYYIAASADKIVAEPATLTGSIGVIAGKVLISGLSDKLGITWDAAQMGKHADIDSIVSDFTPEEHQRFETMLDQVYAGFKDRVAQGRKLSADAVEAVAKGRVWTGEEAKARGLVDALGGFETALALAKSAAGIAASSDVTLKVFPPVSNSPGAIIARLLGRETRPDEARSQATLARLVSALGPTVERIEAAAGRRGALVMPPIELR